MRVALHRYGSTLMSRDRGRRVAHDLLDTHKARDGVEIDFQGVLAGPSFFSELLTALVNAGLDVRIVGAREQVARTAEVVARQHGLSEHVAVVEPASP